MEQGDMNLFPNGGDGVSSSSHLFRDVGEGRHVLIRPYDEGEAVPYQEEDAEAVEAVLLEETSLFGGHV